jgi:hypothetical protein
VLDEIRTFDSGHFLFADDNICGQPDYAKELFSGLIPLKKKWGGQTSITFAKDDELLRLYAKAAGDMPLSVLSLSDNLRHQQTMGKAEDYRRSHQQNSSCRYQCYRSFILGLDNDDPSVFRHTLDFVMKNRIAVAQYLSSHRSRDTRTEWREGSTHSGTRLVKVSHK